MPPSRMAARLRIGSIAKAFAGHLLASLAADGRERKFLPT
jgi:hypothetical protein